MSRDNLGSIVIRPATAADAAMIAAIHVASWRDAYAQILSPEYLSGDIEADRLAVWTKRLRERPANQLVNVAFDSGGRAQGFVCGFRNEDPEWGSLIDNLHVLPDARGQGIGDRLLRDGAGQLLASRPDAGVHLW